MQIFNKVAAQGDVLFRRIDKLPDNVTLVKPKDGVYVAAHSETGHSHVVRAARNVQFYAHANDNSRAYLVVNNEAVVEHLRQHDTHAPIKFGKGIYEIRRQMESSPEGMRRAID